MSKRRRENHASKQHKKLQHVSGREKRILSKYGFRPVTEGSRDVWIHKPTFMAQLKLSASRYIENQQTKVYEHVMVIFRILRGWGTEKDAQHLQHVDNYIQYLTAFSALQALGFSRFLSPDHYLYALQKVTLVLSSADENDELQLKAGCPFYEGRIYWDKQNINNVISKSTQSLALRYGNLRFFASKACPSQAVAMLWSAISVFKSSAQAQDFARHVSCKSLIYLHNPSKLAPKVFEPIGLFQDIHFVLRRHKVWPLKSLYVKARSPLGKQLKKCNQVKYGEHKRYIVNASLVFQHIEPYDNKKLHFNRVRFIVQIGTFQFPLLLYIKAAEDRYLKMPDPANWKYYYCRSLLYLHGKQTGTYGITLKDELANIVYDYRRAKQQLVKLVDTFPFVIAREIMSFGFEPKLCEEFFKMSSFHEGQLH